MIYFLNQKKNSVKKYPLFGLSSIGGCTFGITLVRMYVRLYVRLSRAISFFFFFFFIIKIFSGNIDGGYGPAGKANLVRLVYRRKNIFREICV